MNDPHHPDCECQLCSDHKDPVCGKPAVGFVKDSQGQYRVCAGCAEMVKGDPEAYGFLHLHPHEVAS